MSVRRVSDIHRGSRSSVSSNKAPSSSSAHDLPILYSNRPSVEIDDSALDMEDDSPLPPLPPLPTTTSNRVKRASEAATDVGIAGTYELHPLPSYFSERARRPSALNRTDSDPNTLTSVSSKYYDGALTPAEVATPTAEDAPIIYSTNGESDTEITSSQRRKYRMVGRIQFAATCWCFFLQGWNDGSTGPLLPVIQRDYGVGFAIVSLLFVFNCLVRRTIMPQIDPRIDVDIDCVLRAS